jgi:hypothetical protein
MKVTTMEDYQKTKLLEGAFEVVITEMKEEIVYNKYTKREEERIIIKFTATEEPWTGLEASTFVTPFLTPRAKLTKIIGSVMGRLLTTEEMASIHSVDDLRQYMMNYPLVIFIKTMVYRKGNFYNVFEAMRSKYYDISKHRENALVPVKYLPADLREGPERQRVEEEAKKVVENMAPQSPEQEEAHA